MGLRVSIAHAHAGALKQLVLAAHSARARARARLLLTVGLVHGLVGAGVVQQREALPSLEAVAVR